MATSKKEREYLTAISIDKGIILLIEPNGELAKYRQRGINQVNQALRNHLIACGMLVPNWEKFKELPRNYSIEFEDEEIMGKARATFSVPKRFK